MKIGSIFSSVEPVDVTLLPSYTLFGNSHSVESYGRPCSNLAIISLIDITLCLAGVRPSYEHVDLLLGLCFGLDLLGGTFSLFSGRASFVKLKLQLDSILTCFSLSLSVVTAKLWLSSLESACLYFKALLGLSELSDIAWRLFSSCNMGLGRGPIKGSGSAFLRFLASDLTNLA